MSCMSERVKLSSTVRALSAAEDCVTSPNRIRCKTNTSVFSRPSLSLFYLLLPGKSAFQYLVEYCLSKRMSALHWEARRRQSALDRRVARDVRLLQQGGSDTICNVDTLNTTQEQPAAGQSENSKSDMENGVHHNMKISKRYSALQYSQQW
ncbi:uncharacterized protein ACNS7B_010167 isoform 2-T2 [Menidia menidia]